MRDNQSSGVDIPSPLHIIKRGKSMQVLRTSPRKISSESFDSGPDQPLTVVKSRKPQRGASVKKSSRNADKKIPDRGFGRKSRSITMNTGEIPRFQLEPPFPISEEPATSNQTQDPVTPKCRKVPASRRSSSLQVGRSVSPTFLTKLRSLSNRRASSSKTGRRRHGLRVPSDYSDDYIFKDSDEGVTDHSWDQSSNSGYSVPISYLNEFELQSSSGRSLSSTQGPDESNSDPYLLIPHVSITPESRSLNDGQSCIWTAIEISGQLVHPSIDSSGSGSAHSSASRTLFIPVHHCDASLSRYGYLYNIKVDVLPTAEGSIIDLIGDTTTGKISPGSSLLILACIQLGTSKPQNSKTSRRDPDNLIADLEFQLGNTQTEYIHVRVNYCHSGFPAFGNTVTEDTISSYQTHLETTVTGVVNRYDPTSAWSPKPVRTSNPLFAIIASHWGPARANEIMRRVTPNRPIPRRTAHWMSAAQSDKSEDTIKAPGRTGTAPPVPQRQASLKQSPPDPARKIWTELRRTSSGHCPAFHVTNKANRLPAATTFVDAPSPEPPLRRPESKTEVQRRREMIRNTAVRNRRSIGADSLKSLVPSVAEMSIEGKENNSTVLSTPSPYGKKDLQFEGHGRKREARWSLGSWWQ